MDKIYKDSEDRFVNANIIYTNGSSTNAFKDSECTEIFTSQELTDAFVKGAIIIEVPFEGSLDSCLIPHYKPVAIRPRILTPGEQRAADVVYFKPHDEGDQTYTDVMVLTADDLY